MNKSNLIAALSQKENLSEEKAKDVLNHVFTDFACILNKRGAIQFLTMSE